MAQDLWTELIVAIALTALIGIVFELSKVAERLGGLIEEVRTLRMQLQNPDDPHKPLGASTAEVAENINKIAEAVDAIRRDQ